MDLSLILVTRGRDRYLPEFLESLSGQTDLQFNLLVVDNGSTDTTSEILRRWVRIAPMPVEVHRFENNDPMRIWEAQSLHQASFHSEWVAFPSDDDVMLPTHVEVLKRMIRDAPNVTVVGSGVHRMDSKGHLAGVSWIPKDDAIGDRWQAFGRLLCRPLFPWPALAVRASALPSEPQAFRWTLDWWTQVHAVAKGECRASGEATVLYREHVAQESAAASSPRKQYEAAWMLSSVINDPQVAGWISSGTDLQKASLLEGMYSEGGAIYGDPIVGGVVTIPLLGRIRPGKEAARAALRVEHQLQMGLGLMPCAADTSRWYRESWRDSAAPGGRPEANLSVTRGACERARQVVRMTGIRNSTTASRRIGIACEHRSKSAIAQALSSATISVPCRSNDETAVIAEGLRERILAVMEGDRVRSIGLTPGQRQAVAFFDSMKRLAPAWIHKRVRAR